MTRREEEGEERDPEAEGEQQELRAKLSPGGGGGGGGKLNSYSFGIELSPMMLNEMTTMRKRAVCE